MCCKCEECYMGACGGGAGSQTEVQGATRLPISCATAGEALVKKAAAARAVESTAMNAVSSRSHSVFTLYITGRHETSGQSLQGALNLVDLAGRWVCSPPPLSPPSCAYCCCTVLLLHSAAAAQCYCCTMQRPIATAVYCKGLLHTATAAHCC